MVDDEEEPSEIKRLRADGADPHEVRLRKVELTQERHTVMLESVHRWQQWLMGVAGVAVAAQLVRMVVK